MARSLQGRDDLGYLCLCLSGEDLAVMEREWKVLSERLRAGASCPAARNDVRLVVAACWMLMEERSAQEAEWWRSDVNGNKTCKQSSSRHGQAHLETSLPRMVAPPAVNTPGPPLSMPL